MDIDKIKAKLHDLFCEEAAIVLYESDRDNAASAEIIGELKIGRIVFSNIKICLPNFVTIRLLLTSDMRETVLTKTIM